MKRRDASTKGGLGSQSHGKGQQEASRDTPQQHTRMSKSKRRCSKMLLRLKVLALVLLVLYLCIPILVRLFPVILTQAIYLHRLKLPLFVDLRNPGELLDHTTNFYLTPEDGVTIGVWHTVPASWGEEATGKDQHWFEATLADDNPIIIYLHGNGGTRAIDHRVQLIKVLSAAGFHVLALDYRGFGDSTGEPSEAGVTWDSVYLYEWVKARSRGNPVCLWGHSLGTGIATNAARKLQERGNPPDAVILEAPYTNIRAAGAYHPLGKIFHIYPWFDFFFLDTFALSNHVYPNDENIKVITSPILILHAEDDNVVPVSLARELHETAVSVRQRRVAKLVVYPAELGYRHTKIYKDPKLPQKVWAFMNSI
ncbi:lysophosphatidylserine lipase ABHD12-like [Gastrophryne carolinensis]